MTLWKSLEYSLPFTKLGEQIPSMLSSYAIQSLLVLESISKTLYFIFITSMVLIYFSQVGSEDCHKHQLGQLSRINNPNLWSPCSWMYWYYNLSAIIRSVHKDTGSSTKAKDVTNKETRTAVDHEKKSMSGWRKCVKKCVIDFWLGTWFGTLVFYRLYMYIYIYITLPVTSDAILN